MNYLDIILGILLILSAINGFIKGFVEEFAGLVALILGIWIAIRFNATVSQFLTQDLGWEFKHISVIAFLITFVVVVVIVQLAGAFFNRIVKATVLDYVNKIAGLGFGLIKGALILSIFLVIFHKIDEDVHIISVQTKSASKLYTPIRSFAPSVFPFLDFWGKKGDPENESI